MISITSLQNPEVKHLVALHEAKARKKYGHCIAEGIRVISTLLQGNITLLKLYIVEEQLRAALTITAEKHVVIVSPAVMKKISTATTPSGIVGLFALPAQPSPTLLTPGLVLAQISDPGNMGALIRTTVACGLNSLVIVEGTDPWSPKVIQASAGTISWIKLFELSWDTLLKNKNELKLCALVVQDGTAPSQLSPAHTLLVVGNEAHGIPESWQQTCDQLVTLPMPGKTESLNAAIAGSIALYVTFVLPLCA